MKAIKVLIVLVCCLWALSSRAGRAVGVEYFDSVEMSLITCSPHEEVYSLYGHSALRFHDLHPDGEDLVFNYGVFNSKASFFVIRFIFGLTDYELGIAPMDGFLNYYKKWGSSVTEQTLNLTAREKGRLYDELMNNYAPENRVYRYNFFFDNCSTRPRDRVEAAVEGSVEYVPESGPAVSFRDLIHQKVRRHPWEAFGNDLLIGLRADLKISDREKEFLPEKLQAHFRKASIKTFDGQRRPLVKTERVLLAKGEQPVGKGFPIDPVPCFWALLVASLLVFAHERRQKRICRWWHITLMTVTGLVGCLVTVMLFSQHPATSSNLQALLLNPLHLAFIPSVVKKGSVSAYWRVLPAMAALFLVGAFFQRYAAGMPILALCLLLGAVNQLKIKN